MSNEQNKPNRTRRAIYVFGGTLVFLGSAIYGAMNFDGAIGLAFVQGCFQLLMLIAVSYLFTTSIDRSEVLTHIGLGFKNKSVSPSFGSNSELYQNRANDLDRSPDEQYPVNESAKG